MSIVCITGHQGTGKSTILNEMIGLGYEAYGLDEEDVAGYFNLKTNSSSVSIPQGLDRNLEWRKDNVWKVDMEKVKKITAAQSNKLIFYFGYAVNIEELWDICDSIVVLRLNDQITKSRLLHRNNNSLGKHPGEIELAIQNSHMVYEKAESYKKHPIYYIDASLDISSVVSAIEVIGLKLA